MCQFTGPCADPEGGGNRGSGPPLPGKSQVAMGFLRNSVTDHPQEAIGPKGFIQPSVKYVDV